MAAKLILLSVFLFYLWNSALSWRIYVSALFFGKSLVLDSTPQSVISRIVMKPLIFALWVVFACGGLSAQTPAWQPSPGHTQAPIWPGTVPDAQPVAGREDETTMVTNSLVAGRPWVEVGNVSQPTMTVYSPKGTKSPARRQLRFCCRPRMTTWIK